MNPNFIIAGAAKSGTTSLVDILREHPKIFFPIEYPSAEIHFFDNDDNYEKGIDYYKHFFKSAKEDQIKGEKTPAYSWLFVPERMKEHLPDVKLIWMFRNPVNRAYSHWKMYAWNGIEKNSFEDSLLMEENRLKEHPMWGYKQQGEYINVLKEYSKYYSKDNMLILIFEDFVLHPEENINRITDFLGVERLNTIKHSHKLKAKFPKHIYLQYIFRKIALNIRPARYRGQIFRFMQSLNEGINSPKIKPQTKDSLNNYYKKFNKELEIFLNYEIKEWR